MEVKVYFNNNFPMSLINTEVDITKDLEYVGSVEVNNLFQYSDVLEYVFNKCQLDDNNLGIKLPRSLSVGDVLSIRWNEDECTRFWMIGDVGFKKL